LRRKVLQDFANTFCQQFLDLGSGHDVATFVRRGSGSYSMDLLNGECSHDGAPIPEMKACREYRLWLIEQMSKHSVSPELLRAVAVVQVVVRAVSVKDSGARAGSADLDFRCRAELTTDEKTYTSEMSGARLWGYLPNADS